MPDKEFKIRCLENSATRKHRKKIQQNQENKTKKNENFNKELEIIKKKTEIWELNNSVNETIKAIESITSRMDQVEDISELGDRDFEIIQNRTKKKE